MKLFIPVLAGLLFACCGKQSNTGDSNKAQNEEQSSIVSDAELTGIQRLDSLHINDTVTVAGKLYTYDIVRMPCDSLPKVPGDISKKAEFVDNIFKVKITRGEEKIFARTYYKKNFAEYVNSDMMKASVLRGFVFEKALDRGFRFAVAVCLPQDEDMFVPIQLDVNLDGSTSMKLDQETDNIGNVSEEQEEEGV